MVLNDIRDGPFELLGGGGGGRGAGLFLVRPSFFFLPENQDIFFRQVERLDIFFPTK